MDRLNSYQFQGVHLNDSQAVDEPSTLTKSLFDVSNVERDLLNDLCI